MNVSIVATSHVLPATMTLPAELSQQLRRADTFIQLAVSAVQQCLSQCPEISRESPDRCGLFLGTAHGPMQTGFEVLDLILNNQQTSPTLFSHSVFNAAAGYLARIFALQGRALTLTDFAWPFFQALQQACLAICAGQLDRCLVLQVETYSELFLDSCREDQPPVPGSVCWLLERSGTTDQYPCLTALTIQTRPASNEMYHLRREEFRCDDRISIFSDPLATVAAMNRIIAARLFSGECTLTAPYGDVRLTIEKLQANQAADPFGHRNS